MDRGERLFRYRHHARQLSPPETPEFNTEACDNDIDETRGSPTRLNYTAKVKPKFGRETVAEHRLVGSRINDQIHLLKTPGLRNPQITLRHEEVALVSRGNRKPHDDLRHMVAIAI